MLLVNPKTPLSSAPELMAYIENNKGEAPMLQDLVGGQLQMAFASLQSARPFIESGRLKVLAVTGTQRMDALPKMTTMVEQGLKDEVFQVTGWLGMRGRRRSVL